MKFSIDYNNSLWKIDIDNKFLPEGQDLTAESTLNKNCKVKSCFVTKTIWSFDNIKDFSNSCVALRDAGFVQD